MSLQQSSGYAYLRNSTNYFVPRTQATALKAVQDGLLPEEAFIHKAVNIRPIFEEPYDIMEIERLLARNDLDLNSALLLMRIFEKMIKDPDKELALFAAESINAIELRYNRRIEALRKSIADGTANDAIRRLTRSLYELGMLNFARPVLKDFYLKEAYQTFKANNDEYKTSEDDLELLVRILLERGMTRQAETILNVLLIGKEDKPFVLYLMAQVQFVKKDYYRVMSILSILQDGKLLPESRQVYEFWMGAAADA